MTLRYLPPAEFAARWDEIRPVLAPAIGKSTMRAWDVLDGIMLNRFDAFAVSGPASGFMITQTAFVKGKNRLATWVLYVAGAVKGGPKARITAIRALATEIENKARAVGSHQMRVEGSRNWGRILTDYRDIGTPETPVLVKVLTDG